MPNPVTNDATRVTTTTARLNGDATGLGGLESGFAYSTVAAGDFASTVGGIYDQGAAYSIDITGLTSDTAYQFRATYNGTYGDTKLFTTKHVPVLYTKEPVGEVPLAGYAIAVHTYVPELHYREPAGDLEPVGNAVALFIEGVVLTGKDAEGSMTPTGALAVTEMGAATEKPAAGDNTPTGDVVALKLAAVTLTSKPAEGVLTPTGAILVQHILGYAPQVKEMLGLAAQLDIIVEQGATFRRVFAWQDENGVAISLRTFDLRMTVRPYKDSLEVIANTANLNIVIVLLESVGYFEVRISDAETAALDFIRAVYDIEVYKENVVYRLVEGDFILSKEATT